MSYLKKIGIISIGSFIIYGGFQSFNKLNFNKDYKLNREYQEKFTQLTDNSDKFVEKLKKCLD